ncbi:SEC-C metal-binding domain-containing protein [Nocardioides sp. DS6]|uniref:SEC-C metal-binding domain-containing protein n=1 Tax=Nocardioides eburneus TaxID=3231482 RepID=A0ABV3STV3_9ACTN
MLDAVRDQIDDLTARVPRDEIAPTLESVGRELPHGAESRAEYFSSAADWYVMMAAYDDARRCLDEARADGGETTVDVDVQLVDLLLRSDDRGELESTVTRLRHRARELDDLDRQMVAESFEEAGRLEDAHRWFTVVLRDTDPDDLDAYHPAYPASLGRLRVRKALGLPTDRFDAAAERARRSARLDAPDAVDDAPGTVRGEPVRLAVLYWPPSELERLAERWPEEGAGYGTPEEHRASIREALRSYADKGTPVSVAHGDVDEYAAYCAARDLDPEESGSRAAYSAELARTGRARAWPPGRNESCWCGSGVKFKRCCGRPGA